MEEQKKTIESLIPEKINKEDFCEENQNCGKESNGEKNTEIEMTETHVKEEKENKDNKEVINESEFVISNKEEEKIEEEIIKEELPKEQPKKEAEKQEEKAKKEKTEKENKKNLKEEIKNNLKKIEKETEEEVNKTNKAMDDGKRILVIEVCQNCIAHQYCTHHDEEKYNNMFLKIKNHIEAKYNKYFVARNYLITDPAIGAFEIRINGKILFSKIESRKWPKLIEVEESLQKFIEDEQKEETELVNNKDDIKGDEKILINEKKQNGTKDLNQNTKENKNKTVGKKIAKTNKNEKPVPLTNKKNIIS
jgi:selT/selW/selH-like putative selenoprotein